MAASCSTVMIGIVVGEGVGAADGDDCVGALVSNSGVEVVADGDAVVTGSAVEVVATEGDDVVTGSGVVVSVGDVVMSPQLHCG